jgi:peptidoglycan hydrolase-like protein with peptidoglycan-binding domain
MWHGHPGRALGFLEPKMMRKLLCKRNLSGLILAALTAGTLSVPAVSAQTGTAQSQKSSSKPSTSSTSGASHKTSPTGKSSAKKTKKTKKVKGQQAPTPERISEIQEALARKGALTSAPSGQWDDSTVEAMKTFQSKNGLTPTGKLDALTLQKLGLGSETAGLARPTPPPNSTNRLRNQSSQPAEPEDSDQ